MLVIINKKRRYYEKKKILLNSTLDCKTLKQDKIKKQEQIKKNQKIKDLSQKSLAFINTIKDYSSSEKSNLLSTLTLEQKKLIKSARDTNNQRKKDNLFKLIDLYDYQILILSEHLNSNDFSIAIKQYEDDIIEKNNKIKKLKQEIAEIDANCP